MASIAPILRILGKVRRVSDPRTVPAVEALPARVDDETGRRLPAREARPAYDVVDVIVDTDPGGLVEFVITPGAAEVLGGWLPEVGKEIDVPVRGYTQWKGPEGRRFATNGYSLAGDVLKAEQESSRSGQRIAAAS